MRKFIVFSAVLIIVIAGVYLASCNNKTSEEQTVSSEDSAKAVLARGEYLVTHVTACLDCHSTRDFSKYSGPVTPGTEGMGGYSFDQKYGIPGVVYTRNITPDPETGIGTWTEEDIIKAITRGISKNGDTLFPIMPYTNYSRLAKSDLQAIVAYIKSLKPIKNKVQPRQLMIPLTMVYPPPQAFSPSLDSNMIPPASNQVQYGAYMTNAAVCIDCHTPMTKQGPDFSKMFAGGFTFHIGDLSVNSANITPDSATGIGTWNEERFLNKFTLYREEKNWNYDPGKDNTYMPVVMYSGMTDQDLRAIYAYLRTVTPVSNKVEKYPGRAAGPSTSSGQQPAKDTGK